MISVLLVDDEPQLLELTKFFIQKITKDISMTSASTASEAVAMMGSRAYDALVCDYQMPEMDGLELLKLLRNQKNDIPFVLFTGKGREDVAIEALNSGADFYLQKGGDPNSQFAELASMIKTSVAARRAERDLARNEELFRLLAENSRDVVFRFSLVPEPCYEYVSPAVKSVFGYTPEEFYADPDLAERFVHPEDRQTLLKLTEGSTGLSSPVTVRFVARDGRTVWAELRVVLLRDGEDRVTALEGTVIDVTERVKAEEGLRSSESHYRSIFETAGSAMVIIDENGTIQSVNPFYEKLSGYSKDEIEGKVKWASFFEESEVSRLTDEYLVSLESPDTSRKGIPFKITDKFGAELALTAYAAVIPGTRRTVVSIVDETERRRFEDAMQQASKKMDLLARITRHDIMNQLSVLYGYLELAQERLTDPGEQAVIAKARAASEAIKRHLEFARDYQNMGTKRPQWIDVQAACRRASGNIELKGVKVVSELEGLEVFSDPMLEKVFYNLVDNSIKHGQKTSEVRFSYSHGPDGMRLVYEDDGVGVPPSEKEAIFERNTGDREGRRGYGLYLAREILGITGISIDEAGVHGTGARFEMVVPRGKYRTKREPDGRPRGNRQKRQ